MFGKNNPSTVLCSEKFLQHPQLGESQKEVFESAVLEVYLGLLVLSYALDPYHLPFSEAHMFHQIPRLQSNGIGIGFFRSFGGGRP